MKRLVVHIGAPKTATTYIQHALFVNSAALAQDGVYLPMTGRNDMQPQSAGHHHLAWELTDPKRFRRSIGGWNELATELRSARADTVLLSAEGLSQVVAVHHKTPQLRQRLLELSDDVTVVLVVRDQLSLINSMYCQSVKMLNSATPTFGDYADRALRGGTFDFDEGFRDWYAAPDVKFTVVPFTQFREVDPLIAVLRAARVDVRANRLTLSTESSNVSLGPIAIEAARVLARYLHGHDASFSRRDVITRRLHRIASSYARNAGWCDERYWGWSLDRAQQVAETFEKSNEAFAQAVWGSSWPMPMPVDTPQSVATIEDLTPETVEAVSEYVFAMAHRYRDMKGDKDSK